MEETNNRKLLAHTSIVGLKTYYFQFANAIRKEAI